MEEDTPTVIHCSAGENLLRGTEKADLKIQKIRSRSAGITQREHQLQEEEINYET
jgi:hypothetical protein